MISHIIYTSHYRSKHRKVLKRTTSWVVKRKFKLTAKSRGLSEIRKLSPKRGTTHIPRTDSSISLADTGITRAFGLERK